MAKEVRAYAESRTNAPDDHVDAVQKGGSVDSEYKPYAGTDERRRTRYEANRELRRVERERRRNDEEHRSDRNKDDKQDQAALLGARGTE